MKLEDMDQAELRDLERVLGHLLIDLPDMTISELQDKILEILGD